MVVMKIIQPNPKHRPCDEYIPLRSNNQPRRLPTSKKRQEKKDESEEEDQLLVQILRDPVPAEKRKRSGISNEDEGPVRKQPRIIEKDEIPTALKDSLVRKQVFGKRYEAIAANERKEGRSSNRLLPNKPRINTRREVEMAYMRKERKIFDETDSLEQKLQKQPQIERRLEAVNRKESRSYDKKDSPVQKQVRVEDRREDKTAYDKDQLEIAENLELDIDENQQLIISEEHINNALTEQCQPSAGQQPWEEIPTADEEKAVDSGGLEMADDEFESFLSVPPIVIAPTEDTLTEGFEAESGTKENPLIIDEEECCQPTTTPVQQFETPQANYQLQAEGTISPPAQYHQTVTVPEQPIIQQRVSPPEEQIYQEWYQQQSNALNTNEQQPRGPSPAPIQNFEAPLRQNYQNGAEILKSLLLTDATLTRYSDVSRQNRTTTRTHQVYKEWYHQQLNTGTGSSPAQYAECHPQPAVSNTPVLSPYYDTQSHQGGLHPLQRLANLENRAVSLPTEYKEVCITATPSQAVPGAYGRSVSPVQYPGMQQNPGLPHPGLPQHPSLPPGMPQNPGLLQHPGMPQQPGGYPRNQNGSGLSKSVIPSTVQIHDPGFEVFMEGLQQQSPVLPSIFGDYECQEYMRNTSPDYQQYPEMIQSFEVERNGTYPPSQGNAHRPVTSADVNRVLSRMSEKQKKNILESLRSIFGYTKMRG